MRFKTDENLPVEIADLLRQYKHDAVSVHEQGLAGSADPDVAAVCQSEQRAIVTLDLDFSDIRRYPPDQYSGIIVLRPVVQTVPALLRIVGQVVVLLNQQPVERCLWVVDDHHVRIREPGQSDPT
jgi:predicted nuclease of predicted toxin-antitoxin system